MAGVLLLAQAICMADGAPCTAASRDGDGVAAAALVDVFGRAQPFAGAVQGPDGSWLVDGPSDETTRRDDDWSDEWSPEDVAEAQRLQDDLRDPLQKKAHPS